MPLSALTILLTRFQGSGRRGLRMSYGRSLRVDTARGPCEQTFVAFSNHVDKKHLSLAKLCSILQELTQYQASGIE